MNSNSITQGRKHHSTTQRPFNRPAVWMVMAGMLLAGCGDRPNVEVTGQSPTPAPATTKQGTPKPATATSLPQKPQTELAQMFAAAPTVVLSVKSPEELEKKIKPFRNVTLSPQPNGLKITATNPDPAVLLPEFRGENAIIQLLITSPADTVVEIFYLMPGQKGHGGANRIRQKIKKGENVIYAQLPGQTWTGLLRLDPGMVAGEYFLQNFEVKTASAAEAH